jgi:hypothetical protein
MKHKTPQEKCESVARLFKDTPSLLRYLTGVKVETNCDSYTRDLLQTWGTQLLTASSSSSKSFDQADFAMIRRILRFKKKNDNSHAQAGSLRAR